MELTLSEQRDLIASLRAQEPFPQACTQPEVIETHISWVLLCGDFAYKVKKALDLGFLDFSTLAKRRQYCQEELRLNRRLAPQLYLDVVTIGGSPQQPQWGGQGPAIEYAVKMARFDQTGLLDRKLRAGQLHEAHMDRLAALVADFHGRIDDQPPRADLGNPERVHAPVRDNFRSLRGHITSAQLLQAIAQVEQWSERNFDRLRELLAQRRAEHFVRECHGDMHLGNMALHGGELLVFDGIEFNPQLYWIDVMSEVAFVFMDLDDHGRPELGWQFLNQYLSRTGDYPGLKVLRYYLVYRAMVRAKVAAIQAAQQAAPSTGSVVEYLSLARRYTQPAKPLLAITHGVSGSGKSSICAPLARRFGAVHLRSDRERQRLFGGGRGVGGGTYGPQATGATYQRLHDCAAAALSARFSVLVDATFLDPAQRARFASLAAAQDAHFRILHFHADPQRLRERVRIRRSQGRDWSEADLDVLEHQQRAYRPLKAEERGAVIHVDSDSADADTLAQRLAANFAASFAAKT